MSVNPSLTLLVKQVTNLASFGIALIALLSCGCGKKQSDSWDASEWMLRLFSSGDNWTESIPTSVTLKIGLKQREFRGREIEDLHAGFTQSLATPNDEHVKKFGGRRRKVGVLEVQRDGAGTTFPIYEALDYTGLFAVIVSDNTSPTSALIYFKDDTFAIRHLLDSNENPIPVSAP